MNALLVACVALAGLLGVVLGAAIAFVGIRYGAQAARGLPMTLSDPPGTTTIRSPAQEADAYEQLLKEAEAREIPI